MVSTLVTQLDTLSDLIGDKQLKKENSKLAYKILCYTLDIHKELFQTFLTGVGPDRITTFFSFVTQPSIHQVKYIIELIVTCLLTGTFLHSA